MPQKKLSPSIQMSRRLKKPIHPSIVIPDESKQYLSMRQQLISNIPRKPVLKTLPLIIRREGAVRIRKRTTQQISEAIAERLQRGKLTGRMRVEINVVIKISESPPKRIKLPPFQYEGDDLKSQIQKRISDYLNGVDNWIVQEDDIKITQGREERIFDYTTEKMREQQFPNLVNIFNNVIHISPTNENCVKQYLRSIYTTISNQKKDPIGNLGNKDGVSIQELKQFAEKYNIKMIAYNIHKEVIASYYPTKISKNYKALIFLCFANHIYPINNKYLETKVCIPKHEPMIEADLDNKFIELISKHILPSDIEISNGKPTSFIHDKVKYFYNPYYDSCYTILKILGLEDRIFPEITYSQTMNILEHAYNAKTSINDDTQEKEVYDSFFPIDHSKSAFIHNNPLENRPITTIDKNKAYPFSFMNLPFLLSTDYRTYRIEDNPTEIVESALYVATPKEPNILMPKQDIYCGSHILFCKSKFSFTLQERIDCKTHKNIYSKIIPDLYEKLPEALFKDLMVCFIGSMASAPHVRTSEKATIVKEQDCSNGFDIPCGDYRLKIDTKQDVRKLYNRRPIAIQIKDNMSRILYEKMVELKLSDKDIVQIKTDAITFYTNNTPIITGNGLADWKFANYTPSESSIYDSDPTKFTMKQHKNNNNTLITGYAGNGKSYRIQQLVEHDPDYIILSSKHSAITQHREKNLNADVIQAYGWGRDVPNQKHIIVEEIGIFAKHDWDIIFKCFMLGKKLTIFGDFNQLLPVNEPAMFNSPAFINWLFKHQEQMLTNWRNNFTTEYYDSLINSTDPEYLKEQILKYSTKTPEEAEVIIAYRNDTVNTYNNYMLKHLNKTIDDDIPMIVCTNKLRDLNIYNQFELTANQLRNLNIEVSDKTVRLGKEEKMLRPAYARTLYNLQGDQIQSYYIAPEDIKYFAKSREAYTIISRLIQNKNLA